MLLAPPVAHGSLLGAELPAAEREITAIMRESHRLAQGDDDAAGAA